MNKFIPILAILVGYSTAMAAAATRDVGHDQQQGVRNHPRRRHLLLEENIECVLYLKDIQYEDGHGEESWSCEFTYEQSLELFGGRYDIMDIDGVSTEEIESTGVISGESIMRVSKGGFVEENNEEGKREVIMVVPTDATVTFLKLSENDVRHARARRRNLASSRPGTTLKTLVVRVIDKSGTQIDADSTQLKDDVFEDDVSLRSQYSACSKEQIIIEPAYDYGDGGIVDVKIDIDSVQGNEKELEKAAVAKAQELFGGTEGLAKLFDLVMFCLPPKTGNWVAYAYINGWRSYYNDYWCQSVSAQMHEVGHNLGLAHSGVGYDQYADTSIMGYSSRDDDGPAICFNAPKNYQLSWFDLQKASIDPLEYTSNNPQTFVLNGIDDYKKDGSSNGELITLRLEQYGTIDGGGDGQDYYIGYNRKSGSNRGTTNDIADKVLIFSKSGGANNYGKSLRIAELSAGQSYRIDEYKGTLFSVFIEVQLISEDLRDAVIVISSSLPAPTTSPTQSCDGFRRFQLELGIDNYGQETDWELFETVSGTIIAQEDKDKYTSNTNFIEPNDGTSSYCLQPGTCYKFVINDSWGDGLCCSSSMYGYYRGVLLPNNNNNNSSQKTVLFEGGEFLKQEIKTFCIDEAEEEVEIDVVIGIDDNLIDTTNIPTSSSPTTAIPTISPTTMYPSSTPSSTPSSPLPSSSPSLSNPSSSPSSSPSSTPSSTPSSNPPSSSPSSSHCIDDIEFKYKNNKKRTCVSWVGRGNKIRNIRKKCKRKQNGIRIYDWCPSTCGLVGLGDCRSVN